MSQRDATSDMSFVFNLGVDPPETVNPFLSQLGLNLYDSAEDISLYQPFEPSSSPTFGLDYYQHTSTAAATGTPVTSNFALTQGPYAPPPVPAPAPASNVFHQQQQHMPRDHVSPVSQLLQRKDFIPTLFSSLPEITFMVTSHHKMIFVSSSVEKLLGYTPIELLGSLVINLMNPDDLEEFNNEFVNAFQIGIEMNAFIRLKHKDGHWVTFEVKGELQVMNVADVIATSRSIYGIPQPHASQYAAIQGVFGMIKSGDTSGVLMISALPYPSEETHHMDSFIEFKRDNDLLQAQVHHMKQGSYDNSMFGLSSDSPIMTDRNFPRNTQDLTTHEMTNYYTGLCTLDDKRSSGISLGRSNSQLINITHPTDVLTFAPNMHLNAYDRTSSNEKKRRPKTNDHYQCSECRTSESPEWRKGPLGPKTLCNACGLRWAKKEKKAQSEAGNVNVMGMGHQQRGGHGMVNSYEKFFGMEAAAYR